MLLIYQQLIRGGKKYLQIATPDYSKTIRGRGTQITGYCASLDAFLVTMERFMERSVLFVQNNFTKTIPTLLLHDANLDLNTVYAV